MFIEVNTADILKLLKRIFKLGIVNNDVPIKTILKLLINLKKFK